MRYLVTGGAGFVGSHLCTALLERGHEVTCLDNFLTGSRGNLPAHDRLTIIEGDANNRNVLEPIFRAFRPEGIFHYAAIVGVKRTIEHPDLVVHDIEGIRHIFDLALRYGKPKIIFASSSEVYGEPVEIPEAEDGHINAKLPYAVVKLMGEKFMEAYWQKFELPGCALRFFNVYGPRQESSDYGFVVGIFAKRALQGQPPIVFGDGTQTRDFVYIDDNVEMAVRAMESYATNGHVLNVGTGKPTTIIDLAELVIDAAGMTGTITPEFAPGREDVRHRFPDVSKMRRTLGFRPQVTLAEGIRRTLAWYRTSSTAIPRVELVEAVPFRV